MGEHKKLYKLSNIAKFSVSILGIFNRVKSRDQAWIVYNTKYIYATNYDSAVAKFKKQFKYKIPNDSSLKLHSIWVFDDNHFDKWSDNLPLINQRYKIDEVRYDIGMWSIDNPVDIKTLSTQMSAEDFKEWWHDKTGDGHI